MANTPCANLNRIIYVVSGLPRSGTSMACRMLEAAGITVASDGLRPADKHNRLGYFELEKVKKLRDDSAWVGGCLGKGIKVISHLLYHLPGKYEYKVIFMLRPLKQVLASQNKMLQSLGKPYGEAEVPFFISKFEDHLTGVRQWLNQNPRMDTMFLNYPDVVEHPDIQAAGLADFLGTGTSTRAMAAAVSPGLYHNR